MAAADSPAGIRVKAMLVAPGRGCAAHAVALMPPTAEHPNGFHRLIGGGVEFGETHRDAIIREVREELAAEISQLAFLDVVESVFEVNGRPGHEIVFVYRGFLDPEPAPGGACLTETDGTVVPVVWRPFADGEEPLPLFPTPARFLITRQGDPAGNAGPRLG